MISPIKLFNPFRVEFEQKIKSFFLSGKNLTVDSFFKISALMFIQQRWKQEVRNFALSVCFLYYGAPKRNHFCYLKKILI